MNINIAVFDIMKVAFALIALLAIIFDNVKHKDMRIIVYAYIAFFSSTIFLLMSHNYDSYFLEIIHRFLGVAVAGGFFAWCAYSANRRIGSVRSIVKNKFLEAFKK